MEESDVQIESMDAVPGAPADEGSQSFELERQMFWNVRSRERTQVDDERRGGRFRGWNGHDYPPEQMGVCRVERSYPEVRGSAYVK
jgi:hypothetical protein